MTPETDPRVRDLAMHDAVVCASLSAGGSLVDALVALSEARQKLLGELADLQNRVGRRYRLRSGAVAVYRPPDEWLPLVDLSRCDEYPGEDPKRSLATITFMGREYVRKDKLAAVETEGPGSIMAQVTEPKPAAESPQFDTIFGLPVVRDPSIPGRFA